METVNKNTYTFPDRKYKNRFKNYSINGKSLLILLCFIFSSQVCLGLTIHDQTKYYTITVGRSITITASVGRNLSRQHRGEWEPNV